MGTDFMLRVATMGSVAAAPPEWNRTVVLLDRGPAVGWACLAIRMALDRAESLLEPALRLPYRTEAFALVHGSGRREATHGRAQLGHRRTQPVETFPPVLRRGNSGVVQTAHQRLD